MIIKQTDIYRKRLSLKYPSAVAYETTEHADHVFLRFQTENGMEGWGCASPDKEVTGETPDSIERFLKKVLPELTGEDPLSENCIMERISLTSRRKNPAAVAAVSIAYWDLLGKILGKPVYAILEGKKHGLTTSYTISLLPLPEALKQAKFALDRGFQILKIKIGDGLEDDRERLKALRDLAGPDVPFRLDANQAYKAEECLDLLHRIKDRNIELIEQPVAKNDLEALNRLASKSHIPVMVDEPVLDSIHLNSLIEKSPVKLVNIKFMKCGGIAEAMYMDSICRKHGIKSMVGCMDESMLSITAACHFALAARSVKYIDLDGHFDIIDDPASGGLMFRKGVLHVKQKSGFGVTIDADTLKHVAGYE